MSEFSARRTSKQNLVKATIRSLGRNGLNGCSVRKIAKQANVSVGLINYHYASIDHLIADAYEHLANQFIDQSKLKAASTVSPKARLQGFVESTLSKEVMQADVLRAWLVFWSKIESSPQINNAHRMSNQRMLNELQVYFEDIEKDAALNLPAIQAAIGLNAMIDGLWLEHCLDPSGFDSIQCSTVCQHWIDACCKGRD